MTRLRHFVLFTILGTGCASGGATTAAPPPRPLVQFPSRAELAAIAPAAAPEGVFHADAQRAERWDVEDASLPAPQAAADTSLVRRVEALAGGETALVPSAALGCAARELGRYALAKKAPPDEGLRRYAAARCGSPLTATLYTHVLGEVSPTVPDEKLVRDAAPKLRQAFQGGFPAGAEAGVALVRDGRNVAMTAIVGVPGVTLEPALGPGAAGEGPIVLQGTLRSPSELVLGFVNRGAYGVVQCATATAVPLPRFELRCPMAAADPSAWVSIVTRAPQQLLFKSAGNVLFVRPGARAPYAPEPVGGPAPVTDDAGFSRAVLARLNELRRRAGMRPLELSAAQSAAQTRAVGPLLAAELGGNDQLAGRIALGLMAGWEVGGVIRRGDFSVFLSSSTDDAGTWLSDVVALPFGRWLLLEPDRRYVAFGPVVPGGGRGVGAVVTTYALFDGADHAGDAERVFANLVGRRTARGLAPPKRISPYETLTKEVQAFDRGKPEGEVLNDVLATAVSKLGRDVHGVVFESTDLDVIPFPQELFGALPPYVAVEVTHRRAPGAAWGQYVIFVITVPRSPGDGDPRATAPAARATFLYGRRTNLRAEVGFPAA